MYGCAYAWSPTACGIDLDTHDCCLEMRLRVGSGNLSPAGLIGRDGDAQAQLLLLMLPLSTTAMRATYIQHACMHMPGDATCPGIYVL